MAKSDENLILNRRSLNRALLARQLLLERSRLGVPQALELLVGLQAQSPNPPYVGLWTRLRSFNPEKLSRLIGQRKAVRVALMRSTIHLVTARDCLTLRPLLQPVIERSLLGSSHGRGIKNLEIAAVVAAGRKFLEEQPQTHTALGALLQKLWPDRTGIDLAYVLRTYAPLVQVPPRGLWNVGGPAAHTTVEHWLKSAKGRASSLEDLVLRYLKAFGPATVNDAQAWSGLTRLKETFETLRATLRVFRNEEGHELFDLPRAPRPSPETPAPPRFIPEFDNLLLSHADRSRIIDAEHRKKIATLNGMPPGALLLDGFVAATWKIKSTRKENVLRIETFSSIPAKARPSVAEEGLKLLAFVKGTEVPSKIEFAKRA